MSKLYNILWIDDEWDKMPSFMQECKEAYNLNLIPFKTRKEGIEALEQNLDMYHAVLLDAKMFDESENEVASLKGLGNAKAYLDRLSLKKVFPYFISTGQPDLLDDDNFKELFGAYYEKEHDDEKLMHDIVAAIEKTEALQVKAIYENVFTSLESMGILERTESILLDILLPLHYTEKQTSFKPIHHYNQLRQLVEYIFRACHKVGLVPDQCIPNGIVNLNQSSLYLAGKTAEKAGVRYGDNGERIVPEYIESIIRSVLDFGNVHSHTVELDDEDILKIENILKSSQSNYLVFGLTLQMCEVVSWMANYLSTHNDKAANLAHCQMVMVDGEKSKYEGKLFIPEKDENDIWHCDECMVIISHWESGKMRLKDISDNTNKRTNSKYPYFAKFDKVE